MNITQKLISSHLVHGDMTPGSEIAIRIDQTLTQDSTGTMAYLQFEAMGIDQVKTKRSVAYIDHNMLQSGAENADDHKYIQSVAAKHGIWFSRPGNGICHQVQLERFSIPGQVMPADYYTTILGNPLPEVAIPDVEGGKPVMRDTRATFSLGEQDLPAGLDKNFSARVPVPAGKKMEVGVYVSVENYSVPFTLHCSNPDNGRTRTFSGKLASDRPYDYFYTRTDLTHTDEE